LATLVSKYLGADTFTFLGLKPAKVLPIKIVNIAENTIVDESSELDLEKKIGLPSGQKA
jgi:hypothetical protein